MASSPDPPARRSPQGPDPTSPAAPPPGTTGRGSGGPPPLPDARPVARGGGAGPVAVTVALLRTADPSNSEDYYGRLVDAMNASARAYQVNTPLRLAHFLSQIGHESGFRSIEENGNFTAKRMRQVFGCKGGSKNYDPAKDDCTLGQLRAKLWTDEATYAGNPKNLLSYVYASRMGNGDEASGDGFRYRGRGFVQLTGKGNYQDFTRVHNQRNPTDVRDFVATPELVMSDIRYSLESAFFFWQAKALNPVADTDDVQRVTALVNGGLNGLDDRKARLARVKRALGL